MTSELKLCEWCGSAMPCSDGACPLKRNTRAVPDVPELTDKEFRRIMHGDNAGIKEFEGLHSMYKTTEVPELVRYDLNNPDTYRRVMSKAPNGEYVRYDQAAAMIAAERQAAIDARNLLQYEKDQQWQDRAEAAEAKLAQYLQK